MAKEPQGKREEVKEKGAKKKYFDRN